MPPPPRGVQGLTLTPESHLMALQMTNMAQTLRIGPCDAGMRPSLSWLADELASARPPRMVVLVNPNNPTGECMRPPGGAGD